MGKKDYDTKRNKEFLYWRMPPAPLNPRYKKNEIIKKLRILREVQPNSKIWKNLTDWINSDKKLTLKQLEAVEAAFHRIKSKNQYAL